MTEQAGEPAQPALPHPITTTDELLVHLIHRLDAVIERLPERQPPGPTVFEESPSAKG